MIVSNRFNYRLNKNKYNLDLVGLFEFNYNENNGYWVRSIGFVFVELSI